MLAPNKGVDATEHSMDKKGGDFVCQVFDEGGYGRVTNWPRNARAGGVSRR